jgi:predicted FMN-binding regulatory protein PaiB
VTAERFAARSDEDVRRLLLDHPLAWVVTADAATPSASLLPIRPVFGPQGEVRELVGHFARSNPQVEGLRRTGRALILFLGPHGYVSPSWMADRTQAPTWNYVGAQYLTDLVFTEAPEAIEGLLRDLVGAMESGRPAAWSLEDMGPRYKSLSRGVIGFRANVLSANARFKLGQDERPDVFDDILAGLDRVGGDDLARWMRDFAEPKDSALG